MLLFALHEHSSTCTQSAGCTCFVKMTKLKRTFFLYENIAVMMDGWSLQPFVKQKINKRKKRVKIFCLFSFLRIDD